MTAPFTDADILMVVYTDHGEPLRPFQIWVRSGGGQDMYDAEWSEEYQTVLVHLSGGGSLYIEGGVRGGRPVYLAPGVDERLRKQGTAAGVRWLDSHGLDAFDVEEAAYMVECSVCEDWHFGDVMWQACCEHLWWCDRCALYRGPGSSETPDADCPPGSCEGCDDQRGEHRG